jgi:hypothetical protein
MRQFIQKRRKVLIAAGLLCVLAMPAAAFLGLADIVSDPVEEAETGVIEGIVGSNLVVDASTLASAIEIARLATAEYQRLSGAQRVGLVNVLEQIPEVDTTVNRVGETLGWPNMIGGTVGIAPTVWQRATVAINPNPTVWSEEPPGSSKFLAPLASVEAIDGTASRCLDQIAQYRDNWSKNNPLVTNLTTAIGDDSDAFNGTVGQLNVNNAALAQSNAESRAQTAIQACLAEGVLLNDKMNRDRIATAMNAQQAVMLNNQTRPTAWDGQTTFSVPIP